MIGKDPMSSRRSTRRRVTQRERRDGDGDGKKKKRKNARVWRADETALKERGSWGSGEVLYMGAAMGKP